MWLTINKYPAVRWNNAKYLTMVNGLGNLFIVMKYSAFLAVIIVLSIPQYVFAEQGNPENGAGMPEKQMIKEKLREAREVMKTDIAQAKETFANARQEFKQKLQGLKDERKKLVAEQLDTKLQMINKKRTERLSEKVAKLQGIVTKLEAKKQAAEALGQNVTSVTAAIASAEKAIATAETAIAAQAAKTYTAQVTDETTLKQNFGVVIKKLNADLSTTHKTVVDAKAAVKAAATAVRQIEPVVSGTPVTTTPAVSPAI